MNILALNAYHGQSHAQFIHGYQSNSRHDFDLLTLPDHHWKWRMRHGAITFAKQVTKRLTQGYKYDALLCTDMLNLAEFRGLCPAAIHWPTVVYFHENQLTYPDPHSSQRDLHYAFTNFTTALAADQVWFNSAYHRTELLTALSQWFKKLPDHQPLEEVLEIANKSIIQPPGIDAFPARHNKPIGPMRLLWVSRWEHDKRPEMFFDALRQLRKQDIPFRLSMLGQSFQTMPTCFEEAQKEFHDCIDQWGFVPTLKEYHQQLGLADIVVSTAAHEFFGIAIAEATAAGCFALVPKNLAYPGVMQDYDDFFYNGSLDHLVKRLCDLSGRLNRGDLWLGRPEQGQNIMARYHWPKRASIMDDAFDILVKTNLPNV